ncbi:trehalose-phosphatase [Halorarum halobium]|uniref:trehalose-phosphatase n=1 Tax=Halorarum halobium TaxID=3075121 RepID=UPI0028AA1EAE|nr:trehalose-phosphatase [Halobaculum sp. XH14]
MSDGIADGPPALTHLEPHPALGNRLASAPGILCCLDFDGTLAPIVEDPADAELLPAARAALERLAGDPTVTVAVVSGRSLADLRERVDVADVVHAGNHGLELDEGSASTVDPEAVARRPAVEAAVARLRAELDGVPGCIVEDKGVTASVHYRRTPDEHVPTVREAAREAAAATDGLRLTEGKRVLELRPDVPGGKDRAVRRLREHHPDALPLFVGDDVTDEDAFRALPTEGVAVLVGDREDTAASIRVPAPDDAAAFLHWVADVRADADGPGAGT